MIRAENLQKWFGSRKVVNDVSLTVEKGEILGFLGPNGAGKSTSMRLITGYLPLDGGTVHISGHNIETEPMAAKAKFGYLPENAPAYSDMTVFGFLRFAASLRGLTGNKGRHAVDEAMEICQLGSVRNQLVETLSKGYLHRTCFAQSILHDPEVLILDEPTDGLDPNQKHEVRNLIKRMGERKAIIISTHILEEVDAVCTRVVVLNRGRLVANGLPEDLKKKSKLAGSVVLAVRDADKDAVQPVLEKLERAETVRLLEEKDGLSRFRIIPLKGRQDGLSAEVFAAATTQQWKVEELTTEKGRLEEVFRTITSSEEEVSQ